MIALALLGLASSLAAPCLAEPKIDDDKEFAALQADAKKSFKDGVAPFVKTYCTNCHGSKKRKGGLNFEAALKKPGNTTSRRQWKQAVANVKAHDMPPDDEDLSLIHI